MTRCSRSPISSPASPLSSTRPTTRSAICLPCMTYWAGPRSSARPCSASARCMVLMMSPRSPSSRRVGSASGDRIQRPGSISVASPMRSSLRARSISSARFWPDGVEHVAARAAGPRTRGRGCSAISIRSSRVKRSASTSRSSLLVTSMLGLRPEFQRDDLARPLADAVGDIVAGDVEDAAVVDDAAHDDMGVRDGRCCGDRRRSSRGCVPRSASICFIRSRVVSRRSVQLDAVLGARR